jgi:hypothetical protein
MPTKTSKFRDFFFSWFPLNEVILCFIALFVFNNYIQHNDQVIRADGLGYYNYLPALFIYKDINFEFTDTLQTEFYNHKEANAGIIRQVNGKGVNKYFIGTAVMQSPFFMGAHLIAKNSEKYADDGYSEIYQRGVYHAALIWALVGLIFIRLTLNFLGVHRWWIFWIQAGVFLASSLPNYIVTDASFSHAYSFALISIWTYLVLSFKPEQTKKLLWIGLVLVLIRPINIIILLFLPFLLVLAGKKLNAILDFFRNPKQLGLAAIIFGLVVGLQPLLWYLQTGQWIVRSYGDESFDFLNPHFLDFLFSYRKGFFVYAPFFFMLIVLGFTLWSMHKSWLKLVLFMVPTTILIYVLSSWWYWSYGASYGSRVMIDFYALLLLAAIPLYELKNRIIKWLSIPFIVFFAYLSLLQTYQYKHYIMTWDDMHHDAFWTVFMKTEDKYRGYLWQEKFDPNWSKDELLRLENITLDYLYSSSWTENFEINQTYSRLVVVINGSCSYAEGKNRFLIAIDDTLGNNLYYHEQAVFKSNAQENYSGPIQLSYFIRALEFDTYKLVFALLREEEMNCSKPFDVIVYGLH